MLIILLHSSHEPEPHCSTLQLLHAQLVPWDIRTAFATCLAILELLCGIMSACLGVIALVCE